MNGILGFKKLLEALKKSGLRKDFEVKLSYSYGNLEVEVYKFLPKQNYFGICLTINATFNIDCGKQSFEKGYKFGDLLGGKITIFNGYVVVDGKPIGGLPDTATTPYITKTGLKFVKSFTKEDVEKLAYIARLAKDRKNHITQLKRLYLRNNKVYSSNGFVLQTARLSEFDATHENEGLSNFEYIGAYTPDFLKFLNKDGWTMSAISFVNVHRNVYKNNSGNITIVEDLPKDVAAVEDRYIRYITDITTNKIYWTSFLDTKKLKSFKKNKWDYDVWGIDFGDERKIVVQAQSLKNAIPPKSRSERVAVYFCKASYNRLQTVTFSVDWLTTLVLECTGTKIPQRNCWILEIEE